MCCIHCYYYTTGVVNLDTLELRPRVLLPFTYILDPSILFGLDKIRVLVLTIYDCVGCTVKLNTGNYVFHLTIVKCIIQVIHQTLSDNGIIFFCWGNM